ncbi:unnamed protein product [Ambrosiozyma monospora]|uniref:Unnamed protein product n=1 Tax=Ambrosiozyma monospora TaxID=43982 RepID=A0ACB5SYA1_AMBMO|nr:unnamed protein product [Ambrosiozyma monospora]
MNDSKFRNSPRSLLDDPSEYKFNFSYFIRKKAALERAERLRNERNSVNPNELTVEYLSTRPNAWTEPALEEPNDEFVVKVFAPPCLYYDTLFQYVESWFFIVDSRYTLWIQCKYSQMIRGKLGDLSTCTEESEVILG